MADLMNCQNAILIGATPFVAIESGKIPTLRVPLYYQNFFWVCAFKDVLDFSIR